MKKNTQKLFLSLYFNFDQQIDFDRQASVNKQTSYSQQVSTARQININKQTNANQQTSFDKQININQQTSFNKQTDQRVTMVKLSSLKMLLSDLTDGGVRSLIHFLKNNNLILSEKVLGTTYISITQHGAMLLEAKFPALSSKWNDWQGNWDCLVFTKSLKSDKQFRYLRTLLVTEGAIAVSRGVYISPFSFSDRVVRECRETYHDAVLMFSVGEWKIASLRNLIVEKYGLLDLVESYSGISKEISKLLALTEVDNKLVYRYKTEINLVYDRLIEILREDMGFCSYYFSEAPRVIELLYQLNSIVSRY